MDKSPANSPADPPTAKSHSAGAFDIRNFVGALIGIYGVVLVIMGLINVTSADMARTGSVNANLLAGIVMVVLAASFLLWARIRPVEIPVRSDTADAGDSETGRPVDSDQ